MTINICCSSTAEHDFVVRAQSLGFDLNKLVTDYGKKVVYHVEEAIRTHDERVAEGLRLLDQRQKEREREPGYWHPEEL